VQEYLKIEIYINYINPYTLLTFIQRWTLSSYHRTSCCKYPSSFFISIVYYLKMAG